ncbi:hypothetical protein Tco_1054158 [Tanacetum coccineum]|uniref:Uncharacterized protein n=1 Tax=Tanacetum coccineum TaxID=301880 RepID=A0ABQ5GW06_9ASTR
MVKNMKNPCQTPRGVPVGPNMGFKPVKQVYGQMYKKNNVNTSGNNKKDVEPTIEVNNSNTSDVLNSVENDVDLGTNDETLNLASKKANSSGSSFWNVESNSTSTTPIVDKIDKIERLVIDEKVALVDDQGKPLAKVGILGDHDSGMKLHQSITKWKIFWLQRRLAMDDPNKIQSICDNLDIKVRGRKKK